MGTVSLIASNTFFRKEAREHRYAPFTGRGWGPALHSNHSLLDPTIGRGVERAVERGLC